MSRVSNAVESKPTQSADYARRLLEAEPQGWRRWIDVQLPYRYNLRRLHPGMVLDVGAGVGRNLMHLEGNGVGIDHNNEAVRLMRTKGLRSYTPEAFARCDFARPGLFDSLLFAHVLEHMTTEDAGGLVKTYLPCIKKNGRVIVIVPQEAGYASDPTHVTFLDAAAVTSLLAGLGLKVHQSYSFPFPRWVGRFFKHNETVIVARL